MRARIWKEDGLWEWDVQDDREPRMRSTGASRSWLSALGIALHEMRWMVTR